MKKFAVLVAIVLMAKSRACLWDRDTLARDYKNFPTTVEAIVGRIDRDVPLYFQMRCDRVRKLLLVNPNQPDLCDDIAVAESRLGSQDEAIGWMQKKARLKLTEDQRYRMLSNVGTFRFLEWVKQGKKPDDLIDQAILDIRAALKINPNAHFGREKSQLAFMEWAKKVQQPYNSDVDSSYGDFRKMGDHIKGLTSLIVLGEVWESPDVMATLATALHDQTSADYFAIWRSKELVDGGAIPLCPTSMRDLNPYKHLHDDEQAFVRAEFDRERKLADEYRRSRAEYETKQLVAGRHPDTDPEFWKGWKPRAFQFQDPTVEFEKAERVRKWKIGLTLAVVGVLLGLFMRAVWKLLRSRGLVGGF